MSPYKIKMTRLSLVRHFFNPSSSLIAGKIEGRIEGKLEGKIELIIKKYKKGCTAEETADMLEEPPSQIRQIYDAIGQCAPDYNVEKIYKRLSDQTV